MLLLQHQILMIIIAPMTVCLFWQKIKPSKSYGYFTKIMTDIVQLVLENDSFNIQNDAASIRQWPYDNQKNRTLLYFLFLNNYVLLYFTQVFNNC